MLSRQVDCRKGLGWCDHCFNVGHCYFSVVTHPSSSFMPGKAGNAKSCPVDLLLGLPPGLLGFISSDLCFED